MAGKDKSHRKKTKDFRTYLNVNGKETRCSAPPKPLSMKEKATAGKLFPCGFKTCKHVYGAPSHLKSHRVWEDHESEEAMAKARKAALNKQKNLKAKRVITLSDMTTPTTEVNPETGKKIYKRRSPKWSWCPGCGTALGTKWSFCVGCGTPLHS